MKKIALLFIIFFTSNVSGKCDDYSKLISNEGVGPIKFGMTLGDIKKVGFNIEKHNIKKGVQEYIHYNILGCDNKVLMYVVLNESEVVDVIGSHSKRFVTKEGAHVGLTYKALLQLNSDGVFDCDVSVFSDCILSYVEPYVSFDFNASSVLKRCQQGFYQCDIKNFLDLPSFGFSVVDPKFMRR